MALIDRDFYPQLDAPRAELPLMGTGSTTEPAPMEKRKPRALALRLPDGKQMAITKSLSVGQSSRNHIVVRDQRVSRRHCVIEPGAGAVRVRDLDSTNGTFVNGLRVSTAELAPGGVITIGRTQLRVVLAGMEDSLLVGDSAPMRKLRALIAQVAPTGLAVLICGETGTGKELVARALHDQSGRDGAFIALNCGSIPKDLVESELFGHERGAFTGASGPRRGVFQEANGGTLLLDEIGELPLGLQPRLLRALESGVIRPVGADREIKVNVRVVAATHVDLQAAVARGDFRQDLFYRLAAALVETPPLRARASDLRPLVSHFLAAEAPGFALSDGALQRMAEHGWPGNVRELRNALKRAVALHGPLIEAQHLTLEYSASAETPDERVVVKDRPYGEIERDIILHAIRRFNGNRRAAAESLKIPKSTLCDKAKRYKI